MKRNLAHGPILPLAIVALLVMMVPMFFVANTKQTVTQSQAAMPRVTFPTNEPNVELNATPTVKPTATPKSYPTRTSMPVYY